MREHDIAIPPDPYDLERVKDDFRALSDATRLRLLLHLSEGERSVGALVEELGAPQSTVSRHLGILRAADVVRSRRAGPRIYYRLATGHVRNLLREAFSHAEHDRLGLTDSDEPADTAQIEHDSAGEASG